jgi:putative SbcD/Mre11-related phosphoesterase
MVVLDEWLLTARRIAIHLPTATAVAADLHLGYGLVRRRGGDAAPACSVAQELELLRLALAARDINRLVIAGDLFEDGRYRRSEMVEELLAWLAANHIELVAIVPGNHDHGLDQSVLPLRAEGIRLGAWLVVHGHTARPAGPVVQGHEHPWMRWRAGVEGPCYLVSSSHLVLPAYSADAAGGNVLGRDRRWSSYRCCVIAGEVVLDFGAVGKLNRSGAIK